MCPLSARKSCAWKSPINDPRDTKALLIGSPRTHCSILPFASNAVALVYLTPEISDPAGQGSVPKIMHWIPISTATSAMVFPLVYSISTAFGPKSGITMIKTVCE